MRKLLGFLLALAVASQVAGQDRAAPMKAIRLYPVMTQAERATAGVSAGEVDAAWHMAGGISPRGSLMSKFLLAPIPVLADIAQPLLLPFGVAGQAASGRGTAGYDGAGSFDVSRASFLRVQVWSNASPANAVVNVDERSTRSSDPLTAPWITVTNPTITNPSTVGEYWFVPVTVNLSVNIVPGLYGNGTIFAVVEPHLIGP